MIGKWPKRTGGGGAVSFIELTDVPSSYSGQAGKIVKVNSGEDGLEFGTGGGGASAFIDLTDVPSAYTGKGGYKVKVKSDASGLEFAADTAPAHDLDGASHNAFAGATADHFLSFTAGGKIQDSGKKPAQVQTDLGTDTNAALAGTDGTPSVLNPYVTNSDPRNNPAPAIADANKIVVQNATGDGYEVTDTIPDGTKAVTQAAGTDDETLATTKFVQAAVASIVGDVRVTTATAISTILAYMADQTTLIVRFAAGDYDFGTNNLIWGDSIYGKKVVCEGLVNWQFANGYGVQTWTAANAARYYEPTNAAVPEERAWTVAWSSANQRFDKTETGGGSDTNFPSLTTAWKLALHGKLYTCDATSSTTYVKVASADVPVDNVLGANNAALFQPTYRLILDGDLRITGKTGHVGKLLDLNGLVNSDLCSKGNIEICRTDASGAITRSFDIKNGYRSKVKICQDNAYHTGTTKLWHGYASHLIDFVIDWNGTNFKMSCGNLSADIEHIGLHNAYVDYMYLICNGNKIQTTVGNNTYVTTTRLVDVNPGGTLIFYPSTLYDATYTNGKAGSSAKAYASANVAAENKVCLAYYPS